MKMSCEDGVRLVSISGLICSGEKLSCKDSRWPE